MIKTLTLAQLHKACMNNRFILVRYYRDNNLIGINCAVHKFKMFEGDDKNQGQSKLISFRPCTFMEYISHKTGFTN